MKRVVISLGSNMSDREKNLSDCTALLQKQAGELIQCSQIRDTPSWGFTTRHFLNQLLVLQTDLSPEALLDVTQSIERQMGRMEKTELDEQGHPVYHDRVIDIDILLYDDCQIDTERLVVPHPHIAERKFVLEPLCDLFGDCIVPPFTRSFHQMLENIDTTN